jgi:hypothetical protein
MKFSIFTFLLIFIISSSSFAQFESIDLNKYKLTDFRYGSLNTNLNLDGSIIKENTSGSYIDKHTDKSLTSLMNLNYLLNVSNRKYIGIHSIYSSFSHSFDNSSQPNNGSADFVKEVKENHYNLIISSLNSFYINNSFYYGFVFNSYSTQFQDMSKYSAYNSQDYLDNYISINSNNKLSLQIGYGRIENVTDARQAIYILDDLNKKNRLTHQPNEEETFEFANFITKVLNKRIIDTRNKRIEEYTLIDSFLVSKGIISKQDGKYFAIINDNWNYSRNQQWNTGSKVYFGIVPSYNYSNNFEKQTTLVGSNTISKNITEFQNKGIGLEAGFEFSKIKRLKWINSFEGNIYISSNYYNHYYSNYNLLDPKKGKSFSSNISYSLTFVPNTRTSITGSTGVNYSYSKDDFEDKNTSISAFTMISCNYYFSEKFRLNAYSCAFFDHYDFKNKYFNYTSKNPKINFGVSLLYYFF